MKNASPLLATLIMSVEDGSYKLEQGQFDYTMSNVQDLDSSPMDEHVPPAPREQDILVLSDSDGDNVTVLSPSAGKVLNAVASRNVKVIVIGNPCNTNALICMKNAPNLPAKNFHALTRLDENRAKCQLALKAGVFYDKVSNVTIWGNHSTTQVPDFLNAKINGRPVKEVIKDTKWLEEEFTMTVQKRGGVLIEKWGRSSAASTAVSIVDAIRSLVTPTPEGDWFSTGVYTSGNPYGIAEDIVFSMPCRSKGDGDYELVKDVMIDDFLWERIKKSEAELLAEKRCVAHLTGEGNAFCDLPEDTMLPGEM